MADKRTSRDDNNQTGVGPGITGASGDFVEGTGGSRGVGGTGEDDAADATGQRPDERNAPAPQELGNARPEAHPGTTRLPGSATGSIGGGGPHAVPDHGDDAGLAAGGSLSDVPGGPRTVGPANDRDTSGARAHVGSERAEPQTQEDEGPREGGRDR